METEIRINEVCTHIRKNTERPLELPYLREETTHLRWNIYWEYLRPTCPLGLLPGAKTPTPTTSHSFEHPHLSTNEVIDFFSWWDSQTNPQAAMDRVWGLKET